MSKYEHPQTVGTVEHDGIVYEVDWPFDINDETKRDDVWRPDGTKITRDFGKIQGVSRYGVALKLAEKDRHARA